MQKQRFIYVPVTQWLVLTSVTLHVRSSTPNLDKDHLTSGSITLVPNLFEDLNSGSSVSS